MLTAMACRANGTFGSFVFSQADESLVHQTKNWYMTQAGYVYTMQETGRFVWLTRLIMGRCPGYVIDHANRCPMDNQRENLRHVTQTDNAANTPVRRHSKLGLKGVSFHNQSCLWKAKIIVAGKEVGLGYYHAKGTAATVFAVAHRYYHPALYPGFADMLQVLGITHMVWTDRAGRRSRGERGRYTQESN